MGTPQLAKFSSVQHKFAWDQPPEGIIGSECSVCGQKHWQDAISYYNDLLGKALNNRRDDLLWKEVAKFHHPGCPVVLDREIPRISKLQDAKRRFAETAS